MRIVSTIDGERSAAAPSTKDSRSAGPRVAIVVPTSDRATFTPDEEISLRHLTHFLGGYDKFLVVPEGSEVARPGFSIERFPTRFFGSVAANRALMFSRRFYEAFEEYDFMLLYHLDALVFGDELNEWCAMDYDYIGAPWLRSEASPEQGFSRVGNGGFSLRRISSFLRVIDSDAYAIDPRHYWEKFFAAKPWPVRVANLPRKYLKRLRRFNNVRIEMAAFDANEDYFWSDEARRFYPSFNIAPADVALRFAFEAEPRFCFERNGRSLPFGCHAFRRYDRAFWEPYLLSGASAPAHERPVAQLQR